ncbi:hypothetical protein Q1695_014251 [Nippostrongylus brasiliensis]|nr:hypothetical protein Q1695_014251 [Nippostrongylus brasiliensis]
MNNNSGAASPWNYEDPIIYRNHPAKYLVINNMRLQNTRFFIDYLPEIRQMLKFSTSMNQSVESFTKNTSDFMCIHIRRTDFVHLQWQTHFQPTLSNARMLAKRHVRNSDQ